jgi:hypothetical protein
MGAVAKGNLCNLVKCCESVEKTVDDRTPFVKGVYEGSYGVYVGKK